MCKSLSISRSEMNEKYFPVCKLHHSTRIKSSAIQAFLEYLDCDYPDVIYFYAVCWLNRAVTWKRFLQSATED